MEVSAKFNRSIPFQYAADVRDGKIICGGYIKKAVARFYDWIDTADDRGYILDDKDGMHVIDFFELFLSHTKGSKAKRNERFVLSPYQQFTLYNVFGWKKQNESGEWVRVIRTVYEKVARKNGKTAVLSGLGLYCESFDNESGPEIYVGATKELQAKILWKQAFDFVFQSVALRKIGFSNTQREIRFRHKDKRTGNINTGTFQFLGGDSKTLDGLNPNFAIIDEYHAHSSDGVREILESAMGARKQPLIYLITTAGFNIASVCKNYEDVCKEILDGIKEDDSTFIMIHEPDNGDDWEDRNTWIKANPNLGESVSMEYLIAEHQKAVNQPSKAPNFKTKHLNMWVDAPDVWIAAEHWTKNKMQEIPISKFRDFGCYAGVDLSATTDLTAVVFVSNPDDDGIRYLKPFIFCPEETIDARSKEDRVPYRYWRDAGFLISTPGNTVDYNYVKKTIIANYYELSVQRVEVDRWNSTQMINDLMDEGLEISLFDQSTRGMNYPTKAFEIGVLNGTIKHDGNPVMDWMLAGAVMVEDSSGNYKVGKGKSKHGNRRVDGIIAAIMGLGGSLTGIDKSNQSSYADDDAEIFI